MKSILLTTVAMIGISVSAATAGGLAPPIPVLAFTEVAPLVPGCPAVDPVVTGLQRAGHTGIVVRPGHDIARIESLARNGQPSSLGVSCRDGSPHREATFERDDRDPTRRRPRAEDDNGLPNPPDDEPREDGNGSGEEDRNHGKPGRGGKGPTEEAPGRGDEPGDGTTGEDGNGPADGGNEPDGDGDTVGSGGGESDDGGETAGGGNEPGDDNETGGSDDGDGETAGGNTEEPANGGADGDAPAGDDTEDGDSEGTEPEEDDEPANDNGGRCKNDGGDANCGGGNDPDRTDEGNPGHFKD